MPFDSRSTGIEAKLGFKVHPHMLRHACGYALANKGYDTRAYSSDSRPHPCVAGRRRDDLFCGRWQR
jgi:hypothetical protein